MRIRVTNNSEIDPDELVSAVLTGSSIRLVFKDGSAKTYRYVQLTPEGRAFLEEAIAARGRVI